MLLSYLETMDRNMFNRPIFSVISKINELALLNHAPVDAEIEVMNKEIIKKTLQES